MWSGRRRAGCPRLARCSPGSTSGIPPDDLPGPGGRAADARPWQCVPQADAGDRPVPRGVRGSDRAAPRRRRAAAPGLARPPAAHLRPAGVLPLARRATVGVVAAGGDRRRVRPPGRGFVGVARLARSLPKAERFVRARRGVRSRLCAVPAVAREFGGAGRRSPASSGYASRPTSGEPPARRLASLAPEAGGTADAPRRAILRAVWIDGEQVEAPASAEPTPSELLSGELGVLGRDPVYEAAVRASSSGPEAEPDWL